MISINSFIAFVQVQHGGEFMWTQHSTRTPRFERIPKLSTALWEPGGLGGWLACFLATGYAPSQKLNSKAQPSGATKACCLEQRK